MDVLSLSQSNHKFYRKNKKVYSRKNVYSAFEQQLGGRSFEILHIKTQ